MTGDGAFAKFAGKKAPSDAALWLSNGKPMLFDNGTKGLRLDRERLRLEVVPVTGGDWNAADVLVHDETSKIMAQLLIEMEFGLFPIALGVIYCNPATTFDDAVSAQNHTASSGKKRDLKALLRSGETWSIGGDTPFADA
jgi:2-oxoglutarate ferredoxin oxidoreductase subunit beta